uniref:Uncharacterized protein LOC114325186 n=1 Tax=Diabrotica virgifera virgifera TaxID=50390 RepID=A0A6P7F5F3_DIAVI
MELPQANIYEQNDEDSTWFSWPESRTRKTKKNWREMFAQDVKETSTEPSVIPADETQTEIPWFSWPERRTRKTNKDWRQMFAKNLEETLTESSTLSQYTTESGSAWFSWPERRTRKTNKNWRMMFTKNMEETSSKETTTAESLTDKRNTKGKIGDWGKMYDISESTELIIPDIDFDLMAELTSDKLFETKEEIRERERLFQKADKLLEGFSTMTEIGTAEEDVYRFPEKNTQVDTGLPLKTIFETELQTSYSKEELPITSVSMEPIENYSPTIEPDNRIIGTTAVYAEIISPGEILSQYLEVFTNNYTYSDQSTGQEIINESTNATTEIQYFTTEIPEEHFIQTKKPTTDNITTGLTISRVKTEYFATETSEKNVRTEESTTENIIIGPTNFALETEYLITETAEGNATDAAYTAESIEGEITTIVTVPLPKTKNFTTETFEENFVQTEESTTESTIIGPTSFTLKTEYFTSETTERNSAYTIEISAEEITNELSISAVETEYFTIEITEEISANNIESSAEEISIKLTNFTVETEYFITEAAETNFVKTDESTTESVTTGPTNFTAEIEYFSTESAEPNDFHIDESTLEDITTGSTNVTDKTEHETTESAETNYALIEEEISSSSGYVTQETTTEGSTPSKETEILSLNLSILESNIKDILSTQYITKTVSITEIPALIENITSRENITDPSKESTDIVSTVNHIERVSDIISREENTTYHNFTSTQSTKTFEYSAIPVLPTTLLLNAISSEKTDTENVEKPTSEDITTLLVNSELAIRRTTSAIRKTEFNISTEMVIELEIYDNISPNETTGPTQTSKITSEALAEQDFTIEFGVTKNLLELDAPNTTLMDKNLSGEQFGTQSTVWEILKEHEEIIPNIKKTEEKLISLSTTEELSEKHIVKNISQPSAEVISDILKGSEQDEDFKPWFTKPSDSGTQKTTEIPTTPFNAEELPAQYILETTSKTSTVSVKGISETLIESEEEEDVIPRFTEYLDITEETIGKLTTMLNGGELSTQYVIENVTETSTTPTNIEQNQTATFEAYEITSVDLTQTSNESTIFEKLIKTAEEKNEISTLSIYFKSTEESVNESTTLFITKELSKKWSPNNVSQTSAATQAQIVAEITLQPEQEEVLKFSKVKEIITESVTHESLGEYTPIIGSEGPLLYSLITKSNITSEKQNFGSESMFQNLTKSQTKLITTEILPSHERDLSTESFGNIEDLTSELQLLFSPIEDLQSLLLNKSDEMSILFQASEITTEFELPPFIYESEITTEVEVPPFIYESELTTEIEVPPFIYESQIVPTGAVPTTSANESLESLINASTELEGVSLNITEERAQSNKLNTSELIEFAEDEEVLPSFTKLPSVFVTTETSEQFKETTEFTDVVVSDVQNFSEFTNQPTGVEVPHFIYDSKITTGVEVTPFIYDSEITTEIEVPPSIYESQTVPIGAAPTTSANNSLESLIDASTELEEISLNIADERIQSNKLNTSELIEFAEDEEVLPSFTKLPSVFVTTETSEQFKETTEFTDVVVSDVQNFSDLESLINASTELEEISLNIAEERIQSNKLNTSELIEFAEDEEVLPSFTKLPSVFVTTETSEQFKETTEFTDVVVSDVQNFSEFTNQPTEVEVPPFIYDSKITTEVEVPPFIYDSEITTETEVPPSIYESQTVPIGAVPTTSANKSLESLINASTELEEISLNIAEERIQSNKLNTSELIEFAEDEEVLPSFTKLPSVFVTTETSEQLKETTEFTDVVVSDVQNVSEFTNQPTEVEVPPFIYDSKITTEVEVPPFVYDSEITTETEVPPSIYESQTVPIGAVPTTSANKSLESLIDASTELEEISLNITEATVLSNKLNTSKLIEFEEKEEVLPSFTKLPSVFVTTETSEQLKETTEFTNVVVSDYLK